MSTVYEIITANAEFIADAFTVAHETGKTPRQLAEENRELLEALKMFRNALKKKTVKDFLNNEDDMNLYEVYCHAGMLIAKSQGNAA